MLAGQLLELRGLGIDDVGRLPQVVVNELLVGGVDERDEEEQSGADERETPVGHNLDEVVRDEGSDTSLR